MLSGKKSTEINEHLNVTTLFLPYVLLGLLMAPYSIPSLIAWFTDSSY